MTDRRQHRIALGNTRSALYDVMLKNGKYTIMNTDGNKIIGISVQPSSWWKHSDVPVMSYIVVDVKMTALT